MQCGSAMLMQVSDAPISDIADVWFGMIRRDGSSSSDRLRPCEKLQLTRIGPREVIR